MSANLVREGLEEALRYDLIETETGCWIFTGGSKNNFHGSLHYQGESWQAHRLAYTLVHGPIPEGMKVLHTCDVGMCVRPRHLFLGTQADNIRDMVNKGRDNRARKGNENGRAIIKAEDVIVIRKSDKPVKELARLYRVGKSAIYKIIYGQNWRHIPNE